MTATYGADMTWILVVGAIVAGVGAQRLGSKLLDAAAGVALTDNAGLHR